MNWGNLICTVISGLFMLGAYYETSHSTNRGTNTMARVNRKNTLIEQYNNLFERNNKLSDEVYQLQRDMIRNHQDELIFYQFLQQLVKRMKLNDIQIPSEIIDFLKNVKKKLKEDSENSL